MRAIVLLLAISSLHAESMEKYRNEGKQFAEKHIVDTLSMIKNFDSKELQKKGGREFDGKSALKNLEESVYQKEMQSLLSDVVSQKNSERKTFDENDRLFSNSQELLEGSEGNFSKHSRANDEYEEYRCTESGDPFELVVEKRLSVILDHKPESWADVEVCSGHKEVKKAFWQADAEKIAEEWREELGRDRSISNYRVKVSKGRGFDDYKIKAQWSHIDNSKSCKTSTVVKKKIADESWEEKDLWTSPSIEDLELIQSPKCTLISLQCLESGEREINGKVVKRKCWWEKETYQCKYNTKSTCDFYRLKKCLYDKRRCLRATETKCSLWENIYKCLKTSGKDKLSVNMEKIHGREPFHREEDAEISSHSEKTLATIAIFSELKRELEEADVYDATQIKVFPGKGLKCARNIAGELIYDCCFSHKGIANDLKLSKCDADEIALSDMRERGLCHYVGAYDETMLNMWTSSKKHVFCCFPSKLSRVLQEEAREQIGLIWGDARHPECRGLKQEEIQKIDFSKLDLSEAFQTPEVKDYSKKLESLENRLREKMAESRKKV